MKKKELFKIVLCLVMGIYSCHSVAQIQYGTFKIVNADTNTDLQTFTTDIQWDLSVANSISVVAMPSASYSQIRFTLSTGHVQTEGIQPYALYGDSSGNYNPWSPPTGDVQFTVEYLISGVVQATDSFTITFVTQASDTQSPSAPVLSSSNVTTTTVDLSWSGATDNVGVTAYNLYLNGTLQTSLGNVGTYTVTGLSPSTSYVYSVTALDAAGNESSQSNTVNVTTSAAADTQPPSAPTLTSTGQTDTTVELSWSGATDNVGITQYKVYANGSLQATLGNVSSYQVTGLTASTSYSFTVSALDAAGNEGPLSNSLAITTDAGSTGGGGGVWTSSGSDIHYSGGRVAIGGTTYATGYNLSVAGKIISDEIKVQQVTNWPDYVFGEGYELPSLDEVRNHIKTKGHLMNLPSAAQVEKEGLELGEMNKLLLEKIEELTLYLLQKDEELNAYRVRLEKLENKMKKQN